MNDDEYIIFCVVVAVFIVGLLGGYVLHDVLLLF